MVATGQVLGAKYRLVRLVGDGGMGSVYEAEHVLLGTRVAIKILHGELARRSGLIDRFLQEAKVSAQIKSPHVVQVTDVDQTSDGIAYIVMELLQGEPLSAVLDRDRKIEADLASEYTIQILHALEAAHALGVIHRDLKPENVFITYASGKPVLKLIDFGIAKLKRTEVGAKNLTVAGMMMGTAEYMAPEQAHSADKVDARSDVYSVGVMLYEMLAGSRPVLGDDARVIAVKVERGEVTPLVHAAPGVQPELAGLVHRAMAARPEVRFSSAAEMRLALEGAIHKKKTGTAQLHLPGREGAERPPRAPQHGAPAEDGIATKASPAKDAKTGTLMEAPLPTAQIAEAQLQPQLSGNTVRTGQMQAAPAMQAPGPRLPGYEGAEMPPRAPPDAYTPPRRRGRFPVWAVVLPVLVGAGVGVGLVVSYYGGSTTPEAPTATLTTAPAPLTASTTTAAVVPTIVTATPPLTNPLPPTTQTPTHPSVTPSGHPSAHPSSSTSPTEPPPFTIPTNLIPSSIPSTIPFPSNFPFPVVPPPTPSN